MRAGAVRALVVLAHPVGASLCGRLAAHLVRQAGAAGWEVRLCDLAAEGFDPRMGEAERTSYYSALNADLRALHEDLAAAEVLVLVFPTWWSGFPALLKGWFDRVWGPGVAYDRTPAGDAMIAKLGALREVLVVTTLGGPAWVDWLVMRRPLRRVLARGILAPCAPQARLTWAALYRAEAVEPARLARFEARLSAALRAMARRRG